VARGRRDLPIEHASRFELMVNLGAANAIGLTIPASVLARADEVIPSSAPVLAPHRSPRPRVEQQRPVPDDRRARDEEVPHAGRPLGNVLSRKLPLPLLISMAEISLADGNRADFASNNPPILWEARG